MATKIEQLERQVAVLRRQLRDEAYVVHDARACEQAISEADRIAAETVDATDAEVIDGWLSERDHAVALEDEMEELAWFFDLAQAAAWVRAQGGGK